MQEAGVTMVSVGIFSWAMLEPREGEFEFGWLDRVMDGLHAAGVRVDLATATASPPPWLTHRYPEVLPVTKDGVRLSAGSRQQYCPSSPVYRRLAARLASKIAERYADHPALAMWHINNEYGCHVSHCYCETSADAFRAWLEDRYGTVDALNAAWGTTFWSQRYSEFAEVQPPRATPTFGNPAHLLDFDRFTSDQLIELYRAEAAIVRAATPSIPVTTNFMGFFKGADYWAWAQEVDVVSDDSYPDPADPISPAYRRDDPRPHAVTAPWPAVDPHGADAERRELAGEKRAEGAGSDGGVVEASSRARCRRHPVLPVATVGGRRREVPLGHAAARGHRHEGVARDHRTRRRPRRPRGHRGQPRRCAGCDRLRVGQLAQPRTEGGAHDSELRRARLRVVPGALRPQRGHRLRESRRRPVALRHGHCAEPVLRDSCGAATIWPPTRMAVAIWW